MNHPVASSDLRTAVTGVALYLLFSVLPAVAQPDSAQTSVDSLRARCSRGDTGAMLELGDRLMQGTGGAADTAEGLAWMQKAAEGGNHQAWYQRGVVYANGMGVKTDMTAAIAYFKKGGELGNADCQCSMGLLYQAGEKIPGGVKGDPAVARTWYRKAAEQGHQEAILHLGQLVMSGQGGAADPAEGAAWFRKGADLGSAECQWSLGQCFLQGKGVAQDSLQAYALWDAAVDGVDNPEQKKGMGERRDTIGKNLSPGQMADASRLAAEWKSKRR